VGLRAIRRTHGIDYMTSVRWCELLVICAKSPRPSPKAKRLGMVVPFLAPSDKPRRSDAAGAFLGSNSRSVPVRRMLKCGANKTRGLSAALLSSGFRLFETPLACRSHHRHKTVEFSVWEVLSNLASPAFRAGDNFGKFRKSADFPFEGRPPLFPYDTVKRLHFRISIGGI
jgi:hypothetical protein